MRRPFAVLAVCLAASLTGCALVPLPLPDLEGDWEIHRIESPEISESSGLVKSRTQRGVFWTQNDSGDQPRLFAIDAQGRLLGKFAVEGALARDWEDIAIDDAGNLYIGDVGNNANQRRDLVVYRVPEPDVGKDTNARVTGVLRYRYADQKAFPEENHSVFDAEGMFWRAGDLYIFTKHRSDARTKLYRLPTTDHEGERALEPLFQLETGGDASAFFGNTTGADVKPDGSMLALLTYTRIILYAADGHGKQIDLAELRRIELDTSRTRQAESIAWDGRALIFGNEQRTLFRIPDPLAEGVDRYPPAR